MHPNHNIQKIMKYHAINNNQLNLIFYQKLKMLLSEDILFFPTLDLICI